MRDIEDEYLYNLDQMAELMHDYEYMDEERTRGRLRAEQAISQLERLLTDWGIRWLSPSGCKFMDQGVKETIAPKFEEVMKSKTEELRRKYL